MLSNRLKAMIEQFKQQYQGYGTQSGALYKCDDASNLFIKFVREKDGWLIYNQDIHLFEFAVSDCIGLCPSIYMEGENEMGLSRASWHCIVNTKNVLIDWTAKQYVETAPFPLIIVKRFLTIQKIDGYYKAIRPAYLPIRKAELLAKAEAVGHV